MENSKDWTGNKNSIFKTLGASNHTDKERETNDYYATDPIAAEMLIEIEKIPSTAKIWEPCAGEKHLSNVFEKHGCTVLSSDLVVRTKGVKEFDFLNGEIKNLWNGYIITNPPYNKAKEVVERAIENVTEGSDVCMFLKLQFLEGKSRRELFKKYPPKTIWVSSSRIMCAKNGDFETMINGGGSAVAYAWYIWEKGYKGDTVIKWFN